LSALKKRKRDEEAYPHYEDSIKEEMGDVLWYLTNVASASSISLQEIVQSSHKHSTAETFDNLDSSGVSQADEITFQNCLFKLAAKTGELFHDLNTSARFTEASVLKQRLGVIFESLVEAAQASGIKMGEAAKLNLEKTYDLWPPEKVIEPRFDETFTFLERFPKSLQMDMFEIKIGEDRYVSHQHINQVSIGKQLTDNKQEKDGYRFHDVFHLAFAAILGWSPALRALLRNKRKSQSAVDDGEDGQRAGFLEEGLIALIFQHAISVNYYKTVKKVEYSLLKQIPSFVNGYEVGACTLEQWQRAILQGFEVFNQINSEKRGSVIADFEARTLTFRALREGYPEDGMPANHQA
jgi:hypothetical protein